MNIPTVTMSRVTFEALPISESTAWEQTRCRVKSKTGQWLLIDKDGDPRAAVIELEGERMHHPVAAPGPRVGPSSERGQKKLAKLIAKGRVEPVLEERPGYQLQVGWKRKGSSRHAEEWKLNTPRPFRQPWAVLQRTRGAELITDERRRQQNVLGYDAARDSNYTDHELGKAAVCYLVAAVNLEKGMAPAEVLVLGDKAMFEKMWPAGWDPVHFKPRHDPIRCRVKCAALFWAEADRLVRAKITDDRLRQCLKAVDAQVDQIDRLLTKQPAEAAS